MSSLADSKSGDQLMQFVFNKISFEFSAQRALRYDTVKLHSSKVAQSVNQDCYQEGP